MTARVRSVVVAALVLVAFLVAAELATRTWLQTTSTVADNAYFGRIPEPHARYIYFQEGYSVRRTNAFGFFDDDTLPVRPRRRVLLLGDSFAEGLQVPQESTFASIVERRLPGVEVVNAALMGSYPVFYAATLPEFQRIFRPDVVVIQIDDGDLDELVQPGRDAALLLGLRHSAQAAAAHGGTWAPMERGLLRRIAHQCVYLKLLSDRVDLLLLTERNRWGRKLMGARFDLDQSTGRMPAGAGAKLDSLLQVMRAVNPHLVLVTMPSVHYFEEPPRLHYPLRREFMTDLARRRGIPLVDPTDSLIADFRRNGQPPQGFFNSEIGSGHPNARGHAVIGRLLAEALRRLPGWDGTGPMP